MHDSYCGQDITGVVPMVCRDESFPVFSTAENKIFFKWGVYQTGGLKNILLQKSCFISTLVVSDRPKNIVKTQF